jgi:hypothetical protein
MGAGGQPDVVACSRLIASVTWLAQGQVAARRMTRGLGGFPQGTCDRACGIGVG